MSVDSQLAKIKNAFDPSSGECVFQYYFYNSVPAEQAALYVKSANEPQAKWDKAVAERPSPNSVPVLATGFNDLQRRVQLQEAQVMQYRTRLHEINNKLTDLTHKYDLNTTTKISQARSRHAILAHRTIALASRLQVVKSRGYALRSDEEAMKRRFADLLKEVSDPAVFGRLSEIWARMTVVKEKAMQAEAGNEQSGNWQVSIDWESNARQLELITKALTDMKNGVEKIVEVTRTDNGELDKILTALVTEAERSKGPRRKI